MITSFSKFIYNTGSFLKRNIKTAILYIALGFNLANFSCSPTPSPDIEVGTDSVTLKDNVMTSTDRLKINVAAGDTTLEFYNFGTANSYQIFTKCGKTKKNTNNAIFDYIGNKDESIITKIAKNSAGAYLLTLDGNASFMLSNKKGLLQPVDNNRILYIGITFEKVSYQEASISGVNSLEEAKKVYVEVLKKSGTALEITGATSGYAGDNAVKMAGQNYKFAISN